MLLIRRHIGGMRDYEHPAQIGAEPSPIVYVENLRSDIS